MFKWDPLMPSLSCATTIVTTVATPAFTRREVGSISSGRAPRIAASARRGLPAQIIDYPQSDCRGISCPSIRALHLRHVVSVLHVAQLDKPTPLSLSPRRRYWGIAATRRLPRRMLPQCRHWQRGFQQRPWQHRSRPALWILSLRATHRRRRLRVQRIEFQQPRRHSRRRPGPACCTHCNVVWCCVALRPGYALVTYRIGLKWANKTRLSIASFQG